MKPILVLALTLVAFHPFATAHASDKGSSTEVLTEIAHAHEQVAKGLTGDHVAVVIQKGDKQFTIYGVVFVRAVGPVVEITVKNGEKYSVGAADIFFITNNGFKI